MAKVRALRGAGIEVEDFSRQGPPPSAAIRAATEAMGRAGSAFYTDPRGEPELRRTIARKLAVENAIQADPDGEIVVTVGAKEAILVALLALVGEGDEVMLEDPGYLGFEPLVRLAGATPVPVRLRAGNDFRPDLSAFARALTPRTKVLLLSNPHNPTGRVLARAELEEIARFARDARLVVVMDEAYEHFVFDGRPFVSLASLPGAAPRTITIQTVSKVYNMAGWRIGWLVAGGDFARRAAQIHTHTVTCPAAIMQAGAEAAIRGGLGEGDLPFAEIKTIYAERRTALVEALRAIPGVEFVAPEGGYFGLPDFASFGMGSAELSEYLLDEARVAATPGIAFGDGGEGHLRFVFKIGGDDIRRAAARIAEALARLPRSAGARPAAQCR
jgi:aspartate aminotransferase